MARKRMIDPGFWTDPHIAKLTRDERLLFVACMSAADDEGRLLGSPAFLRAQAFPYDDNLTIDDVAKMRDHILKIDKNLILYVVDDVEYMAFLKWSRYQKPSHPTPSRLPPAPSGNSLETLSKPARNAPSLADPYQEHRLGKVSIGKVSSTTTTDQAKTDRAKTIAAYVEAYVPHFPGKEPPISEYPTDSTLRDIEYMADVWGDDVLQEAIRELKKPKLPPKYLEQIIKRWKKEGKAEPKVTPRERDVLRTKWGV